MLLRILLCLLFSFPLTGETQEVRPFAVLTIPKSGTHLIEKLFNLMQPRERFGLKKYSLQSDKKLLKMLHSGFSHYGYTVGHVDRAPLFFEYIKTHPHLCIILQIRDLRDVMISAIFHMWKDIEKEVGPVKVQEVLRTLLKHKDRSPPFLFDFENLWSKAVEILQYPHVVVSRFEDLIGSAGGGDDQKQFELIYALGAHIGLDLDTFAIQQAVKNLFGNTTTFRKGQIGSWKQYFSDEDLALFNKRFGHLQLALGYSLD